MTMLSLCLLCGFRGPVGEMLDHAEACNTAEDWQAVIEDELRELWFGELDDSTYLAILGGSP